MPYLLQMLFKLHPLTLHVWYNYVSYGFVIDVLAVVLLLLLSLPLLLLLVLFCFKFLDSKPIQQNMMVST